MSCYYVCAARYFSVNVPLKDNITDGLFSHIFDEVLDALWEAYQPQAVILQAGCDSVYGVSA